MTPELEELRKLAERLRQIVKKYEAKNPLRTADFHGEDCACYRCAVDACDAAVNALPGLIARVEEMEAALANMADCQPLPKIYKYTGTAEVDVENMFDVGHRHVSGKKPYDYLKSWLSMLRPFAYATQDDSWGELEKLISIVMNNYVQILVKAESARAALRKEP